MSKLKNALQHLRDLNAVLVELDGAGIDVDRLIGLSNAQGDIAKRIRAVIDAATSPGSISPDTPKPTARKEPKRKRLSANSGS